MLVVTRNKIVHLKKKLSSCGALVRIPEWTLLLLLFFLYIWKTILFLFGLAHVAVRQSYISHEVNRLKILNEQLLEGRSRGRKEEE